MTPPSKLMGWVEAHSKALAALIVGGVGEAISDGLLNGAWEARARMLVFLLTATGVYLAPANKASD